MAISPRARLNESALQLSLNSGDNSNNNANASAAFNNTMNTTTSSRGRSGSPPGSSAIGGARFDAKQHTVDVLTQELNGARAAAKRANQEVALLRHQISVLRGQGIQIRTDKPASEETWIVFCRAALALGKSPDSTVLRTLHQGIDIEVPESCDFVQFSALAEATRVARPDVRRLTLDVAEASHVPFIVQTLDGINSLRELSATRANDASIAAIVHAVSAHPELEVLELPNLMIGDDSAGLLRKTLHERSVLAAAGAAQELAPMELDFSKCYFKEPSKFAVYGGRAESLVVAGQQFFTFVEIRSALESCTSMLTNLNLSGTMIDNRISSLLDSLPNIRELNLVACASITHIRLKHVTHLHTDGKRVVEFNCPSLVEMCTPLTHFAPAIVSLPKVEELSFLNATITKREMELLGASAKSTLVLKFLGCRLESLDTVLRQLRQLKVLSLHSCKGVRDSDVAVLFEPLVELDLTDNFVLTDAALDMVAKCPHLERLSLKRCQNITDVGIAKLEGHPALRFVNCLGLKKVSAAAVQRLIKASLAANGPDPDDGGAPLDVRHSTAISTDTMIERDDDEEKERAEIAVEERKLSQRRATLAAFTRQQQPQGQQLSSSLQSPSRLLMASRGSSSRGGTSASASSSPRATNQQQQQQQQSSQPQQDL